MIDIDLPRDGSTAAHLARVEARPGSEEPVEKMLCERGANVAPDDGCWWALRFAPGEHAVFTTLGASAVHGLDEEQGLLDGDVTVDEAEVLAGKLQPLRVVTKALVLRLPVRASAEGEAIEALCAGKPIVDRELETVAWFALRFADGDLGIVSAFPDRHSRRAHLNGRFARDVGRRVFGMLDGFPSVEHADVIEQRRPRRRR